MIFVLPMSHIISAISFIYDNIDAPHIKRNRDIGLRPWQSVFVGTRARERLDTSVPIYACMCVCACVLFVYVCAIRRIVKRSYKVKVVRDPNANIIFACIHHISRRVVWFCSYDVWLAMISDKWNVQFCWLWCALSFTASHAFKRNSELIW